MMDLLLIPAILAIVALFVLSFICVLISFGRSEDLRERIEKLIYARYPEIPEGRIPRLRAYGKLDMTCDNAFEYAEVKGILTAHPELIAEYWRLRSFRAKSLAGAAVGFLLLFVPATMM